MKGKLKKRLRELLIEVVRQVDADFEIEPNFTEHPHLSVVRRRVTGALWQFLALSFSAQGDRFFVEVAYSPNDTFPVDRVPLGYEMPPHDGKLRFRASGLWRTPDQSGGWVVKKISDEPPTDSIMIPEGIFDTPEAAMADVKERIVKYMLPYFEEKQAGLSKPISR